MSFKRNIYKSLLLTFVFIILLILFFPVQEPASADMGPKPSVVINFEGLSGQTYYVTLLSKHKSTGPHSAPTAEWGYRLDESDVDFPIFLKFAEYEDSDGYYFLQFFQNCSTTHKFTWGYYPPSDFKILIYLPDSDSFVISSEAQTTYAFASSFRISISASQISSITQDEDLNIDVFPDYDYIWAVISLIARIILTVAIELAMAIFLFGFRKKPQIVFITVVNVITQIALNLTLNLIAYYQGFNWFLIIPLFFLLEIGVIIVEAVLYTIYLPKFSDEPIPKWKIITYTIFANIVSLIAGFVLAAIIPGIF